MKIQLSTPLKDLTFPNHVEKFWDETLISKYHKRYDGYSPFSNARSLPTWRENVDAGRRVYEIFKYLADFHSSENFEIKHNNQTFESSSYLSVQMLDILNGEGINITQSFSITLLEDPQNDGGWSIGEIENLYLQYLDFKNEIIPDLLLDKLITDTKENKRYYRYKSVDDNIGTYFQLLKVIPQDKITYDWFTEHLNLFSLIEDEETRELVSACKNMGYDNQKRIYDYISQYFPKHVEDNKQYYSNLLPCEIFTTNRLYQGSIDINIFQLIHQCKLTQNAYQHLCSVAKECLNVVASSEFMQLIDKDIAVSNINTKESNSILTLNFSTDSYENLETFEKIVLTALKGVLQVSDKIRLSWSESYYGEDVLITNMDAKFVHQHYLYHALNDTLEETARRLKRKKI